MESGASSSGKSHEAELRLQEMREIEGCDHLHWQITHRCLAELAMTEDSLNQITGLDEEVESRLAAEIAHQRGEALASTADVRADTLAGFQQGADKVFSSCNCLVIHPVRLLLAKLLKHNVSIASWSTSRARLGRVRKLSCFGCLSSARICESSRCHGCRSTLCCRPIAIFISTGLAVICCVSIIFFPRLLCSKKHTS